MASSLFFAAPDRQSREQRQRRKSVALRNGRTNFDRLGQTLKTVKTNTGPKFWASNLLQKSQSKIGVDRPKARLINAPPFGFSNSCSKASIASATPVPSKPPHTVFMGPDFSPARASGRRAHKQGCTEVGLKSFAPMAPSVSRSLALGLWSKYCRLTQATRHFLTGRPPRQQNESQQMYELWPGSAAHPQPILDCREL